MRTETIRGIWDGNEEGGIDKSAQTKNERELEHRIEEQIGMNRRFDTEAIFMLLHTTFMEICN